MLEYGTSTATLLKLINLPYVEVFTEQQFDGAFLDPSLEFCPRWGGEALLVKKISREMHAIKGDSVTYTQILLNHYTSSMTIAQNKVAVLTIAQNKVRAQRPGSDHTDAALDVDLVLHDKVKAELERSRIKNYAVAINANYQAVMEQRFTHFCVS